MDKGLAQIAADLFCLIAAVFILNSLVMSSVSNHQMIVTEMETPKTHNDKSSASAPTLEEMAQVFFVIKQGDLSIEYKGESGEKTRISNAIELLNIIERQSPGHLSIFADENYPIKDIYLLQSKASSLGLNLYMVTEHAK